MESSFTYTIEEFNKLSSILSTSSLSLNCERLFTDEELVGAKATLQKLDLSKVENIFYSDFGFYMLLEELNLTKLAVYRAPTYLTNTSDVNLHLDLNKSVVVSNKISSEELQEICKNANKGVYVDAFLMDQIFYSRRKLITNYLKYKEIDLDPALKTYTVKEELRNDLMHILEDNTGTHIFEKGYAVLSSSFAFLENTLGIIIHTPFLTKEEAFKVLEAYDNLLDDKQLAKFYNTLKELKLPFYSGLYDRKTILLKEKENA